MSALPQPSSPHSQSSNFFQDFNAIVENQRYLTPAEFRLAIILLKRGAHREDVSLSAKTWEDWTGLDVKSRDLAIRGLTKKGFNSEGRGDRARFRFDRSAWATTCRTADRSFRPKVEQKRQPAKPGQMIHPECRDRGCFMARQSEGSNVVNIGDTLPNWKPVSNCSSDIEARGEPAALVESANDVSVPERHRAAAMKVAEGPCDKQHGAGSTPATHTTSSETSAANSRATNKPKRSTPSTATPNWKPVSNSANSSPSPKTSVPGILCEQFIGLFLSAGKPLNKGDLARTQSRWCELSPDDQVAAFNSAHEKLIQTADPQFIPLPANFLSDKPWTRKAMPRSLPVVEAPKKSKRATEREALIRQAVEGMKS